MRRFSIWFAVLAATVAAVHLVAQSPDEQLPLRGGSARPILSCGTSSEWELAGRYRPTALFGGLADGEPLNFDQNPPLLYSDYRGTVTFDNFSVVGDFATVQFFRADRDLKDGRPETWTRINSRVVNGQVISVFAPSWDASAIDNAFALDRVGFDEPMVYWGAYQLPGSADRRYVYARVGLRGIPVSPVVRLSDQVQYASDVVNIVVPGFADARVSGGANGFDITAASKIFYQYFEDSYDVLALAETSPTVATYAAFHRVIRNTVSGLNIPTLDQSPQYGSNGVLQGVEVFTGSNITTFENTDHEMAHQWGSDFDWTQIAGITRAGHQPTSHAPLWTGGETLIGAVLLGDRRVAGSAGAYAIEQTPVPAHYHPIELYSMGLLTAEQVPDFRVFSDQMQFDPDSASSPAIGTAVQGDARAVSIRDVIRVHGARVGPTYTSWRRATVVVSRDRLATQDEMNYWNFFAQKLSDRNQTSRATFDHFVTYQRATGNAVRLSTSIRPLQGTPLPQQLDTDTTALGQTDFRGVTFTSPVPTRFAAGQSVVLSGHITATDPVDFTSVLLGFWTATATTPVRFSGAVNKSGDFSVTVQFTEAQRDLYALGVYLFWSGSGNQAPRSFISTVAVE